MFGINDPSALLRPWRNLQQFSEELYAMFSRGAAIDSGASQVSPGKTAQTPQGGRQRSAVDEPRLIDRVRKERLAAAQKRSRIPDVRPGDSHASTRRPDGPGNVSPNDARQRPSDQTDHSEPVPGRNESPGRERRQEVTTRQHTTYEVQPPIVTQTGLETPKASLAKEASPSHDFGPRPTQKELQRREGGKLDLLDIGDFMKWTGGSDGTTVFMGKVQSGSGDTYQVVLYQNSPTGSPDADPVTVTVPMIDPSETINPDTWLSAIFEFQDSDGNNIYFCQPPVWMA